MRTLLPTFMIVASLHAHAGDGALPPQRPLGALLGLSSLAFTGWPAQRGTDGPCGKAVAYWQVREVLKGDKGLKGKVVPIYGTAPRAVEARTTMLFLKGRADCPELVEQTEIGADAVNRSIQHPDDCNLQIQVIDRVLRGLATDCERDDDCDAFSLHPNSCVRPSPYARRARTATPSYWAALTARARSACGAEWSKQPACAPLVVPVHCHENECVAGPAIAAMPRFARATLGPSCAPTDGPAVVVVVHPEGAEYPQLNVNWWAESRPQKGKAGTFELGGAPSYNEGYGASYCPVAQGCQQLRSIKLRMRLGADGKGDLEIEAETQSGEKIDAKVPAEFGPERRVFCG